MNQIKKAFTLAEVLITLLIIGAVSSLVIPAILSDTQESEYTTGAKKVYADLNNAIKMIQVNGRVVNTGNDDSTDEALRNDFCNVMTCTSMNTADNLFSSKIKPYYKNGYESNDSYDTTASAALNNGTLIKFRSDTYCGDACGSIVVDINGTKGPNMMGADHLEFDIVKKGEVYSILPKDLSQGDLAGSIESCNDYRYASCTAVRIYAPVKLPTGWIFHIPT